MQLIKDFIRSQKKVNRKVEQVSRDLISDMLVEIQTLSILYKILPKTSEVFVRVTNYLWLIFRERIRITSSKHHWKVFLSIRVDTDYDICSRINSESCRRGTTISYCQLFVPKCRFGYRFVRGMENGKYHDRKRKLQSYLQMPKTTFLLFMFEAATVNNVWMQVL